MCKLLIENGADVTAVDSQRRSPSIVCAIAVSLEAEGSGEGEVEFFNGKHTELTNLLREVTDDPLTVDYLEAARDFNDLQSFGRSPLTVPGTSRSSVRVY
jgi:hypothetical protein